MFAPVLLILQIEKGDEVIMEGFGVGFAIGIGTGFGGGFGSGIAAGIASARKTLQKQLRKAIADNEVSIRDKNGEPLTVDAFFVMLDKNYKKV
jgi:hypothetical protein